MGIYLNPGNEKFKEDISKKIYIDKTLVIKEINRIRIGFKKYISVSRPRRFGKTYIADMLCAYYSKGSNSKELFDNYKIAKEESYLANLNKYNVLRLDIGARYAKYVNLNKLPLFIEDLFKDLKEEFINEFPNIDFSKGKSLDELILKVYQETNVQFVIIFDEYDTIFREEKVTKEIKEDYVAFLRTLFKNADLSPAIALAYITGIMPIVKANSESALNEFMESIMLDSNDLDKYIGFTEDEVKDLCDRYNVDFDGVKSWYDGYTLDGYSMYNSNHTIKDYWGGTASFDTLKDYIITKQFRGLSSDVNRILIGEKVGINPNTFENNIDKIKTKDEVFTYLVHLGYLAFDAYPNTVSDDKKGKGTCRIPNSEVKTKWNSIIIDSKGSKYSTIRNKLKNSDKVARIIHATHLAFFNSQEYYNENLLKAIGLLAYGKANDKIEGNKYITDRYTILPELHTREGIADMVIIPKSEEDLPIIIEFKVNKSVDDAINQIKNNNYMACLEGYNKILLVVLIVIQKLKKKRISILVR